MNVILDMLKNADRSTKFGAACGFLVAFGLWLLQQVFIAAWHYTLVIPEWVLAGAPVAAMAIVTHLVRDEYAPGKLMWTKAERAEQTVPPAAEPDQQKKGT